MDFDIARELERTMQSMRVDNMATEAAKSNMARELMQADIKEMLANDELNNPIKIKHTFGEQFKNLIDRIKKTFG